MEAEAAHLLSHAQVCHKAFGYLAEACVGVSVDSGALQRVLGASKVKRRKILVDVKGGTKFTSLKGHKFNKGYCGNQKRHFSIQKIRQCFSFPA